MQTESENTKIEIRFSYNEERDSIIEGITNTEKNECLINPRAFAIFLFRESEFDDEISKAAVHETVHLLASKFMDIKEEELTCEQLAKLYWENELVARFMANQRDPLGKTTLDLYIRKFILIAKLEYLGRGIERKLLANEKEFNESDYRVWCIKQNNKLKDGL